MTIEELKQKFIHNLDKMNKMLCQPSYSVSEYTKLRDETRAIRTVLKKSK